MVEFFEVFSQPWAFRALIASILVGLMCGMLGVFIVLRNMALIGDALAHAILPGIVVAFILFGYSTMGFFIGAVSAGILTALGITIIQQKIKTKNDAAIGIVFTVMFSLGVMGISWISRNEGVHLDLKDFLFGNVLGVSDEDLYMTFGVAGVVILSLTVFYRYLFISTFQEVVAETMGFSTKLIHYYIMLLLSIAVVASLRTVGVILVVAMLITPASTALLLTDRLKKVIVLSGILGMTSALGGLVLGISIETTPGPAMAVVATFFYVLAALFSRKKGLVFRWLKRKKQNQKILLEDYLKQAFRQHQEGKLQKIRIQKKLNISDHMVNKLTKHLIHQGYLTQQNQQIQLTVAGIEEGSRLVRAHRLWETYLVDEIGLDEGQIHEEAEKYEHYLTPDILDEVDEYLGFPKTDPHGSPIPSKEKTQQVLAEIDTGTTFLINTIQSNKWVEAELWEIGLLPNIPLELKKNGESYTIHINEKEVNLSHSLANKIEVTPYES